MKKILFVAAVITIGFTSCKKDRTCSCTYTSNPASTGYTDTKEITYKKVSKGTAKRACVSTETTYSGYTNVDMADCKLK